jgi:hypothetical protein
VGGRGTTGRFCIAIRHKSAPPLSRAEDRGRGESRATPCARSRATGLSPSRVRQTRPLAARPPHSARAPRLPRVQPESFMHGTVPLPIVPHLRRSRQPDVRPQRRRFGRAQKRWQCLQCHQRAHGDRRDLRHRPPPNSNAVHPGSRSAHPKFAPRAGPADPPPPRRSASTPPPRVHPQHLRAAAQLLDVP